MTVKRLLCIFVVLVSVLNACSSSKTVSVPVSEPDYWPTTAWKSSTPEAQGMDSVLLAQMLENLNANEASIHSVLVIRNGYVVTESYFQPVTRDMKMHVQSVTKSVIGALVGIAVQQGLIKSADESMLSFFPNRMYYNPSRNKESIRLKHLLSMSSGFPCQEFTDSGQSMEQSGNWSQYMLDLPVDARPGKVFGYCDGNPHLLSVILEKTTGLNTREFANQQLFEPLGIPAVEETEWWIDPQGVSIGSYGLFLRPVDMAKLAFLYLHNGKWEGQQILSEQWIADSTTQHIQKPEGPGYGYLWTVYPDAGHYAALGLAGQQIHVYPSKNLIVIVTAEIKSFAEAPEIERMLNEFILPSIKSDTPLAENPDGVSRIQAAVKVAANPVQPVPPLSAIAKEISGQLYTLEENANGWENIVLFFEPDSSTAQVSTNGYDNREEIGLDNIYRLGNSTPNHALRGYWMDDQTFVVEWAPIGDIGSAEVRLKYIGDSIEIRVVSFQSLLFDLEPTVIKGSK